MRDITKDDLRWYKKDSDERESYLETLRAMCLTYGRCCGRWHDNEFWYRTLRASYSMTEKEAKKMVFQIEDEADADLAFWKSYQ